MEGRQLTRRDFMLLALATSALSPSMVTALAKGMTAEIPRRALGSTGEKVSIVGIGGDYLGVSGESEAIKIVHTALDSGINFLDNCWDYNGGVSEERMGKALKNGYRSKAFVMTKID